MNAGVEASGLCLEDDERAGWGEWLFLFGAGPLRGCCNRCV